jgi:hypothetical protein
MKDGTKTAMSSRRPFNECRHCGELNRVTNKRCALCGARIDPSKVRVLQPPNEGDTATAVVLIVAIGVVMLGLFLAAPGLGIFLAILSAVPLLRTMLILGHRSERGTHTSLMRSVVMFLGSLGVSFAVVWTVLITAVVSFFCICFMGPILGGRADSFQILIVLWVVLALGMTGAVAYSMRDWFRTRWRRDVGEDEDRRR